MVGHTIHRSINRAASQILFATSPHCDRRTIHERHAEGIHTILSVIAECERAHSRKLIDHILSLNTIPIPLPKYSHQNHIHSPKFHFLCPQGYMPPTTSVVARPGTLPPEARGPVVDSAAPFQSALSRPSVNPDANYKSSSAFATISDCPGPKSGRTCLFPSGMIGTKQNVNIVSLFCGRTEMLWLRLVCVGGWWGGWRSGDTSVDSILLNAGIRFFV